ncbi:inositol polyphosphate multikinase [Culex quinquefasciatus]|uniref:Kinase n=2 Tax=Culex pipiens complex TaxID=518105 RepID=B0WI16_CULQU|nr:inositol polyphosphate multikinase [Culex quinquefasciatus]|eukprot:XP_001848350.1 inositol polyphosphate multikinase [Culex quinquefasciatus]
MSHHHLKLPPYQKRRGHASSLSGKKQPVLGLGMSGDQPYPVFPEGVQPLENQVAGHTFEQGTDILGLLKNLDDGSILKPAGKVLCGVREIKFYETIQAATTEKDLVPLKEFIPGYKGHLKLPIDGKPVEFIKLTDLTHGMLEPCIMDVKIGCRTWDPLATPEKRKAEESKYQACKRNLGMCIPGFQVYSIVNGRRMRYGKEYGKKLTEVTVKDAFRKFLNADSGLCRQLLMQFLSDLWNIQKWARTQTTYRLYSSSVLLVYDARRLKPVLQYQTKSLNSSSAKLNNSSGNLSGTSPAHSSGSSSRPSSPTQVVPAGHRLRGRTPAALLQNPKKPFDDEQLRRGTTSLTNADMKAMRENYVFMRDNLVGSYESKVWASGRMIDFAHAFPAEEPGTIDTNYLQGIESLVRIFEEFLKECEAENAPKQGVA